MIALLSMQMPLSLLPICAAPEQFWTYVPGLPLLHPAAWDFEEVRVTVNDSRLMGGINVLVHYKISGLLNYTGRADAWPVYFSKISLLSQDVFLSLIGH